MPLEWWAAAARDTARRAGQGGRSGTPRGRLGPSGSGHAGPRDPTRDRGLRDSGELLAERATRLAWTYGLVGWRWEGGDRIKTAGEVLRPSACSYLSYRIGGWPASRPWPAAIREVPAAGLREWQALTGLRWPVELSCIGVLLFGFVAPGEADPGALQAEAYTRDGRRVPHRIDGENLRRWTLGNPEGRVFEVAPASRPPVGVAVCEAPAEALAIAAAQPRTLVLAVGDRLASSARRVRGHLPRGLPVRLYGRRCALGAARLAGEDLAALGHDVERPWLPPLDAPYRCDFADYRAQRRPRTAVTGSNREHRDR